MRRGGNDAFRPAAFAKVTGILAIAVLAYLGSLDAPASMRHAVCVSALEVLCISPVCGLKSALPGSLVFRAIGQGSEHAATSLRAPLSLVQLIWLAGSLVMVVRFLLGLGYLSRLSRAARSSEWIEDGRRIRFASVTTPIVWGWIRPVILLPQASAEWSKERLTLAIRHESAHLDRRDNWVALLAAATRAVYWFHPLLWWLISKLTIEQEIICDEQVLASGASLAAYAELLLDVSRTLSSPALFRCAMFSNSHQLRGRIMKILEYPSRTAPSMRTRFRFVLALAALVSVGVLIPARGVSMAGQSDDKVYKIGNGVKAPRVLTKVEPKYTKEAQDKKMEGTVVLTVVIDTNGVPKDIRVIKGLGDGLDEKAVEAVEQWRFAPASKDDKPVSVSATIEVNFKLK